MTQLENWLKQATPQLSRDSAARVRTEIQEHYESAREAALSGGATVEKADQVAVTALGDAKTANCQYRNVLLTSAEARLLNEGNWEARAVCSSAGLKWILFVLPGCALAAAVVLFLKGDSATARVLLSGGIGMGCCSAAHFCRCILRGGGALFGG